MSQNASQATRENKYLVTVAESIFDLIRFNKTSAKMFKQNAESSDRFSKNYEISMRNYESCLLKVQGIDSVIEHSAESLRLNMDSAEFDKQTFVKMCKGD